MKPAVSTKPATKLSRAVGRASGRIAEAWLPWRSRRRPLLGIVASLVSNLMEAVRLRV
jgi:hypothetical protein